MPLPTFTQESQRIVGKVINQPIAIVALTYLPNHNHRSRQYRAMRSTSILQSSRLIIYLPNHNHRSRQHRAMRSTNILPSLHLLIYLT